MNEGERKNGTRLKEGQEVWKSDLSEEEIQKIKNKIGKNFENVKFRFTKYPDIIYSLDNFFKRIGTETEASLAERQLILKQADILWDKIDKLEDELYALEIEIENSDNENEKNILKNKMEDKKKELEKLLVKDLKQQYINPNITENN